MAIGIIQYWGNVYLIVSLSGALIHSECPSGLMSYAGNKPN